MACVRESCRCNEDFGDLGDLVVLLLAGTLAGLRDHLYSDGFCRAGDHLADLVDLSDAYLAEIPEDPPE